MFGDFRGYVEFFLLQDLVSEDYSAVRFWDGWKDFSDNSIPQTVEGYLEFLEKEVEFVGRRGERISFKAKENLILFCKWLRVFEGGSFLAFLLIVF